MAPILSNVYKTTRKRPHAHIACHIRVASHITETGGDIKSPRQCGDGTFISGDNNRTACSCTAEHVSCAFGSVVYYCYHWVNPVTKKF